jgi:hypothetical protein
VAAGGAAIVAGGVLGGLAASGQFDEATKEEVPQSPTE